MWSFIKGIAGKLLGPAISGGISATSARKQNEAARREAERARAFTERMSSTAHQREVQDLRKAGLNPILSATGGSGASTPGAAIAPVGEILGKGVNTAMALRRQNQELENMKAQEHLAQRQALATDAQAGFTGAQTALALAKIPKESLFGTAWKSITEMFTPNADYNLKGFLKSLPNTAMEMYRNAKIGRDDSLKGGRDDSKSYGNKKGPLTIHITEGTGKP